MSKRVGGVVGVGILVVAIVTFILLNMPGNSGAQPGATPENPREITAGAVTATAPVTEVPATATATSTATAVSIPASPLAVQGESPPATATAVQGIATVPQFYTYRVRNVFPHDANAWTQGLVFADGILYEGTGLNSTSTPTGKSDLRKVDLDTGKIIQQQPLDDAFFGEGIAVWDDKIYQLTWKGQIGFLYDKETLTELDQFDYPTQGWGLTHDGTNLIMSDGSATLYFRNPETFEENARVSVTYLGQPVAQLNELEYVDGAVYANVLQTDLIVRVDPITGEITGVIDLTGLLNNAPPFDTPVSVLNGIAYDEETDRLFVTGKWWPALFEIELVETDPPQ